jgi:hypothetical protein
MAENSDIEMSANIHWSTQLEDYLASTGEKAHCLSWVHKRAQAMYSTRKTYIELPAIVLASLVGFLSVGSATIFAGETTGSSVVLGGASLVVSVLNTVGAYFGWARRSEGHRISSMHYAKLYRTLYAELCLPRDERMFPQDILKFVKEQYDRLAETSPLVPPEIIKEFQTKFAHETDISKPEETNGLEKIHVYRAETKLPTPAVSRLQSTSATPNTAGLFYKAAKTLMARNKSFEGASEILSPTLAPIQEELREPLPPMNMPAAPSPDPAFPSSASITPTHAEAVQEALRDRVAPKIASMVSFWKDPSAKPPEIEIPTRPAPPPPEAPPS